MTKVQLGNITLEVDVEATEHFYASQIGFTCDCKDCTYYQKNIPNVQILLKGLDKELGINLLKDVGQGMDELVQHEYIDSSLIQVPYYVVGRCYVYGQELEQQSAGPIWSDTKRAEKKLSDQLSLVFINTSQSIIINDSKDVITIWLEFKTEKTVANIA